MTSPYLERGDTIMRMAKALRAVDNLANSHHRATAYTCAGISAGDMLEHDRQAIHYENQRRGKIDCASVQITALEKMLAAARIRRSIYNMEQKNAPLHRKRPVAVDIVENQTPERVLVRRPASA